MTGYDTASLIQDVYQSAHSEFKGNPNYWVRYFSPCPNTSFNSDPVTESKAAWSSGAGVIGPVTAPSQSRLAGSKAEGHADAQTFVYAMSVAYNKVTTMITPDTNMIYCWLDEEASTSLSLDYWNAWAEFVSEYDFGGLGTYPLYPSLYCDPKAKHPNCSIIDSKKAHGALGVWSSEPEPCGGLSGPKSGHYDSCAKTPTALWQFGEQQVCGYSADVDLDVSPLNYPVYCFRLDAKP